MEVKEALRKRRSIRDFTEEPVSETMIEELLHAGFSAPSAANRQTWHFYVITEVSVLEKVRQCTRHGNYQSPLAIIVCGDNNRFLANDAKDYWIEDCAAATENMLLRATDLGLGAVWCGVYPQDGKVDNVKSALHLPDNLIPFNILYIGHSEHKPEEKDYYDINKITYIK